MNRIHPTAKLYRDSVIYDSEIGRNAIIGDFSRIRSSRVGDYCSIDRQNLLLSVDIGTRSYSGPWDMIFHCLIGKYCSISYGVTIGPPEHDYSRVSTHPFVYDEKFGLYIEDPIIRSEKFSKRITVGNDVWIGCNSTVLRGVSIGDGAIVAANSVVTKDVPPYAVVAGTPSRIIKYRFSDAIISRLLELSWWNWDDDRIRNNSVFFKKKQLTIDDFNSIV